jgi:hypothetical protein
MIMVDEPAPSPAPITPAADPAAPPAMSLAEATSRRDEMINDPAFRERYLNGEVAAAAEMAKVTAALVTPEVKPGDESMDTQIAGLRSHFEFSPEVELQVRSDMPVTSVERERALAMRANLHRDPAWRQRYLDGGVEERKQSFLISVILASKVRDPAQP